MAVPIRSLVVCLLSALAGCSALLASSGDKDLSSIRTGGARVDVEKAIGRPREVEELPNGVHATYLVKIGKPKDSERAKRHLAREGDILSGDGAAAPILIPAALFYEIGATTVELFRLGNARSHRLEVWYDKDGRVSSWIDPVRLPPPGADLQPAPNSEKQREKDLNEEWNRVRKERIGH